MRSPLRQGRASFCDICQHTSSRSLFAVRWPVSALPTAKKRARLNTCRSRHVSASCTRCRCYNVFVLVLHSHHNSIGGRLLLLPQAAWDGLALCYLSRQDTSRGVPSQGRHRRKVCACRRQQEPRLTAGVGACGSKRTSLVEGTVSWFLCHTPITRPAACGRSRRTSSSSGISARRGGLEEARLVNLA